MSNGGPLDGVRVLDLSNYLAGPVAVKILRQLGADVVKFEAPGGDPSRRGSGLTPEAEHNAAALTLHCNKRSISVDLKHVESRDILYRLIARADVLIENYRPGLAATLGVDYDTVSRVNPRIVYCSVSGYGSTGPMAHVSTTDGPVQAFGGLPSLFSDGQTSPVLLADVPGGMFAALAILGALYGRERTGKGCAIDVGMFESMLQMIPYQVQETLTGAPSFTRRSSAVQIPMLETSDQKRLYVQLPFIATADRFNRLVAEMSGKPDLMSRFSTAEARATEPEVYVALVKSAFLMRSRSDWLDALWAAGIPAAPANTLAEALHSDQLVARSGLSRVPNGDREVDVLANPFHFPGGYTLQEDSTPPPWVGQHTQDILRELGYDDAEIAALERTGAINSVAVKI